MAPILRRLKNKIERSLNIELRKRRTQSETAWDALVFTRNFEGGDTEEERFIAFCERLYTSSCSQLFQDLFVLNQLGLKRDGFFVEFGATDGRKLSNTFLLEKEFGWNGILAEPAHVWRERLMQNRGCIIDTRCVSNVTGETVTFNETDWAEISTIDRLSSSDYHASLRAGGKRYTVETVSLNDLLQSNGAPKGFEYLSVDTEGSELEILEAFDIESYKPMVITVEHNFTENRLRIFDLLTSRGYNRVFKQLSKFDDWYVRR